MHRFKTEILKTLPTFTGEAVVLKENCYVGNPSNLFGTIAYILLAGSKENVASDVKKLEEMEKDGSLFE